MCWRNTICLVFNGAWTSITRTSRCEKPFELDLKTPYLKTSARVVLAYFFCTVQCDNFREEMLGCSFEYVNKKHGSDRTICHLGHPDRILSLTKEEMSRILEGWPPFYRKTFESAEGHRLDSPLTTYYHARRPGWIVAIGLGRVQPTGVYVDAQGSGRPSVFCLAIERVERVLKTQFEPKWPYDPNVKATVEEIRHMIEYGPPDGYESHNMAHRGVYETVGYPNQVPYLTEEQCKVVLRVFNDMDMNQEQKEKLEPNLKAVLSRVSLGVAIALCYYKSHRRQVVIPHFLQGDKVVYLRDCAAEDK
jgi:hypothetical protein